MWVCMCACVRACVCRGTGVGMGGVNSTATYPVATDHSEV